MLCESNLRCDVGLALADDVGGTGSNQCVAQSKYSINARCFTGDDCLSGKCGANGCEIGIKHNGETCQHSEECASQSCHSRVCVPTQRAGQQCSDPQDCRIGYFCRPSTPTTTLCLQGYVGINSNNGGTTYACADDSDCLSGTYCSNNNCVGSLNDSASCPNRNHRICKSGYCAANNVCAAAWTSSDDCTANADKCGHHSFCLTANSVNRCRVKSSFGGPCSDHSHCQSGVCNNSLCANPTGTLSGATCNTNSDCAAGNCFQPTSVNTCQKFIANGGACVTTGTDYCGPGYFCSQTASGSTAGTCKQLYIGSYSVSPPTTPHECEQGNLSGGSCQDVIVRANGLTLNYPYKAATSATCTYLNWMVGSGKTPVNGYCPIVSGTPEYKDYLRAVVTFLSRSDVHAWPWLPVSAYKQVLASELAPYFAAASGDLNATFTNLRKHHFNITHTNILEESCGILGDTCGPEVPAYAEDFNTHCRGEESYTFECGAPASGAVCAQKTYALGTSLTIRFSNAAMPSQHKCPALDGPTSLASQTYS